ncbi:MAG: 3'-5' exonuclease [Betaproteobacteria bacterium]|nr:3'-5' exonuclease [Betaproteobacteria bacterium]
MIPVLVFDIETIPDCEGLIRLYELDPATPHAEVAERAFSERREKTGSDFLPHYLQRVVSISCALRNRDGFKVWSLGTAQDTEASIIQRFYDGVDKYTPQLVSWNGKGFDAQVLHYRSLVHGLTAARYWDTGEDDRDFKWNNYLSRYHPRHLDLMDVLAMYNARANAPLDALAKLIGFPGKLGMDGSAVWTSYQAGDIEGIRAYCETDVLNTYLLYTRFQLLRGQLTSAQYQEELQFIRATVATLEGNHWQEFLAAWPA